MATIHPWSAWGTSGPKHAAEPGGAPQGAALRRVEGVCMDEQVLAAMARWPNVPDVYGWLSLSARGIWHLHPDGHGWDASGLRNAEASATGASTPDPVGEPIT